jgi:hypothetical protein
VLLLPSVALASVWAPALVLSAAQTVELPPSVLVAVWAPALAVLLPMVQGLCPPRARFSPMGRRLEEQAIVLSR